MFADVVGSFKEYVTIDGFDYDVTTLSASTLEEASSSHTLAGMLLQPSPNSTGELSGLTLPARRNQVGCPADICGGYQHFVMD